MIVVAAFVVPVLGSPALRAQSPDESARRIAITLGVGGAAAFPGSLETSGPALRVAMPLLVGPRGDALQVRADVASTTVFGVGDRTGVWEILSLEGLVDLYLGPVLGFELHIGIAGIAQVASPMAAGVGLAGGGAWVFRFWEDDRRRLKLEFAGAIGGYFGDDPGNDLGMNAAAGIIGLGYETPL